MRSTAAEPEEAPLAARPARPLDVLGVGECSLDTWLEVEALSQEIRYTSPADQRFRWIAGAYIIATDRFISTGNVFDDESGVVPEVKREPLSPFAPQFTFLADSQDNLAWAAFGELSYDLTDQVELSVALRYDRDERENTTDTPQVFIPGPINCVQPPGIRYRTRVRSRARSARRPGTTGSRRRRCATSLTTI